MLVPNGTLMSIYFARTSEWIDLDPRGSVVARFVVPLPDGTPNLRGMAAAGEMIVANLSSPTKIGFYVLDRRTRQWQAARSDSDFSALLGADENGVLLRTRSRPGATFVTLLTQHH